MSIKLKKYVIPALAVTMIGAALTTPIVSANASGLYLTKEESKEIVLQSFPGIVEEVELENEDGYLVYEVEVQGEDGIEYEVIIDAETAEIVAVELDYDDDDDRYDDNDDGDDDDDDDDDIDDGDDD
ncbi:PepSY domain-containing protein [Bacillus sp. FJAT-27251]|uniref:PepSY domain-containing protein n=1 Tax=Bacillus sp. FJAT-27251 TaxID=1684142 RepID=UPI0006A78585|nr:PepSY domain-containing protein [Bacillus sp. FJAT-27251]